MAFLLLHNYTDFINFSIAVDDIEELYKLVNHLNIELYRELTRNIYQVNGIEETQIEF